MNWKQLFWTSLITAIIGSAISMGIGYLIARKKLAEQVNANPVAGILGWKL